MSLFSLSFFFPMDNKNSNGLCWWPQKSPLLVPVDVTPINTLYVFVDIGIDTQHFVDTVKKNFEQEKRLVLVGTIQFVAALQVSNKIVSVFNIWNGMEKERAKKRVVGGGRKGKKKMLISIRKKTI